MMAYIVVACIDELRRSLLRIKLQRRNEWNQSIAASGRTKWGWGDLCASAAAAGNTNVFYPTVLDGAPREVVIA